MGKKHRKAATAAARERAEARIAPVVAVIEAAFDGVPVPDHEHRTLYQAEAWDDYERVDRSQDHEGRWQDLPDGDLLACQHALPHLDAQGIRYYSPAVMVHFLRKGRGEWIHESLLYTLQPATGDLKAYQRERLSLLTPSQRRAILMFVEHVDADESTVAAWRRVAEADDDWFRAFY